MLNAATNPKSSALLKAAIYWVLFMVLLFAAGAVMVRIFPARWERFVYGISGTIGSFIAVWVMLAMEKRSFADYGLTWQKSTFTNFIKGLIIGTVSFGLIILILLMFTELRLTQNTTTWDPLMLCWYLAIIPLALMEEVAFRSYAFLKLNTVFGLRITQLIVAVVFALYHIVQGWNWQIAFLGPGIWALVFGLAAAWSKGIAVPTGIHVALNLMQTLFGMKEKAGDHIWSVQLGENASAAAVAQAQTWGIVTQVLVFMVALILTEFFIRKKQKNKIII